MTDWPPTVTLASRGPPVFAWASNGIVPGPLPDVANKRSHVAELSAVHEQPANVFTAMLPAPESELRLGGDALTSKVHGRAS